MREAHKRSIYKPTNYDFSDYRTNNQEEVFSFVSFLLQILRRRLSPLRGL